MKSMKIIAVLAMFMFIDLNMWPAVKKTGAGDLPKVRPEDAGMSSAHLSYLDAIVKEAIDRKDFPGAVLIVTRRGNVVYRKAFGYSRLLPEMEPMREDMIFDLASVTKPVATATSVMILVERGRIRLWDKVKDFVPEFVPYLKEGGFPGEDARLYHLLTHTSGLPPYIDEKEAAAAVGDPCSTVDLVGMIAGLRKESEPGQAFVYSCLNYITLAHIIKQVSGQDLAEFSAENIFKPLGMTRTFFNPPEDLRRMCVPTQVVSGVVLQGVVHDPLARLQGGISGNAGLFSTADDLAVFSQMLLNKGSWNKKTILGPLTVERMLEIYPKVQASGRGLGWDFSSDYATVGGDLFNPGSFGHSGYTGTSIWIDPSTGISVIFLTNRVHPDDGGQIISMRSRVANIVAASISRK